MTPPVVLTIAGSDSGGGAGIQADLKTFAALGAYGTSVITAITAQNTRGVTAVHPVPVEMVAAQLDAVLSDFDVAAVKVGMIGERAVAELIRERGARLPNLVVDPVLVATSGARLAAAASVAPLTSYGCILTPNRQEAGALTESSVETAEEMVSAAVRLAAGGARAVVVTGSELAVDVLWHDGVITLLEGEPVDTRNNHGSGCTFSSALAVRLALGDSVPEAAAAAKKYVTTALRGGRDWRLGAGPGPLNHFA
jgi:hydroxymethylpyrimidine/phosphomethylpyrimidine kinase